MNKKSMYYAGLVSARLEEVGQNKSESLTLKFSCSHRVEGDQNVPLPALEEVDVNLWLSDGAWPYTSAKLKRLEFNGDFENPSFGDKVYEEGVWLTCEHEEYNGKLREKWDLYYERSAGTPVAADRASALSARYRSEIPPAPASKPAPPLAPTSAPTRSTRPGPPPPPAVDAAASFNPDEYEDDPLAPPRK